MTAALIGAAFTVVLGYAVMLCTDKDVRDGTLTVLWGLVVGPVTLFLILVIGLTRVVGWRPPVLKGRRLSTAALRRATARIDAEGWAITWRGGGLMWIRKARAK